MFRFVKNIFLCFILTVQGLALADIEEYGEGKFVLSKKPLFVSLGGSCHTALALRGAGLRVAAFPFDWLISTNHHVFLKILDEDFQHFTDASVFALHQGVPASNNLYYNIGFPHDFDLNNFACGNGVKQWDTFKEKYDRRINRFRQLRQYPGKVFFVRAMWSQLNEGKNGEFYENKKRAQELRSALDRYFPSLNFTLIILSYNDLPIPSIHGVKGVVEWKIGRSHQECKDKADEIVASIRTKQK